MTRGPCGWERRSRSVDVATPTGDTPTPCFSYQGETKDLQAESLYEGETKELGGSGE